MKDKILRISIFAGFGLSGVAALIYEVVWTRSLSTIMGSSTYALSTMLAAFMSGLALGGWTGSALSQRIKSAPTAFAFIELMIGATGMLTIPVINHLMPLYMKTFYSFHLSFNSFSAIQFIICFIIMGVPTTLMGMTFPLMIKIFSDGDRDAAYYAGKLYSVNTFGSIIGAVSAGFLLIPLIGSHGTAIAAACINIVTALTIMLLSANHRAALLSVLVIMAASFAWAFLYKPMVPFFSYYSAHRFPDYAYAKRVYDFIEQADRDLVVYSHDGPEGNVSLVKSGDPSQGSGYVLVNNGKLEAGNDLGFALLAYIPFCSHDPSNRPLQTISIGLGSGHTLKHLLNLPVARLTSIELNEGILEANSRYLNPELFRDPRISHYIADGRSFLAMNSETYDLIIASPSWAVEEASAGLLTREFFSLAASRLQDHGVFALWLDDFIETDDDMKIIARTASKSFEHVALWTFDEGRILVGSHSPLLHAAEEVMSRVKNISPGLAGSFSLAMNEEQIHSLGDGPINTDDLPVIEFDNARIIITGKRSDAPDQDRKRL